MPSWTLRAFALIVTGLSMVGSTSYALANPKNPNAPLRPPVVTPEPTPGGHRRSASEASVPTVEPTQAMPFRTLSPTEPPTPTPTPKPTTPPPTPRFTAAVTRPSVAPTPTRAAPTLRPTPQITLSAGVRATQLPRVTITHSS
jgi:hypothetical protein